MVKKYLVMASPRSGSNLLQFLLMKLNRCKYYYPELFITPNICVDEELKLYNTIAEKNNNLVLKFMYIHLHRFKNSEIKMFKKFLYNNKFYIIRLKRNDLREQIFSWAIALTSQEFELQTSNKFVCSYNTLYNCFQYILDCQIYLKNNYYNIPIDQEVNYEDLLNGNIMIDNVNIGAPDSLRPEVARRSIPKSEKLWNFDDINRWYDQLEKTYEEKVAYANRL